MWKEKMSQNKIYIWTSEKLRGLMLEGIWNKQKKERKKKEEEVWEWIVVVDKSMQIITSHINEHLQVPLWKVTCI